MSITAITNNDPLALQSFFGQPQNDLRALANDLGSGNLASAQKDFASLQKDVSEAFQALNNATGSSVPANASAAENTPAADLHALQSALNANDLAAAQKSFAAFQQDARAFGMQRAHHRHRHVDPNGDEQDSVPDFTTAAMLAAYKAFGSASVSNSTNNVNVVA